MRVFTTSVTDGWAARTREQLVEDLAQALIPGAGLVVHGQLHLREHELRHAVEQPLLVLEVPVQRHRRDAEVGRQPADGEGLDALGVRHGQGPLGHGVAAEPLLRRPRRHVDNYTPYMLACATYIYSV